MMTTNSNKSIKENLDSFNYDYLNFISPETKKIGNIIIILSSLIILLNLNIVSLTEIESNGLKLLINENYISYILLLINVYFFTQFYYYGKLDNLNFKLPKEINKIIEHGKNNVEQFTILADKFKDETERFSKLVNDIDKIDFDENTKNIKKERLKIELDNHLELIEEHELELEVFLSSISETERKMRTGNNYLRINKTINLLFPKIMFIACVIFILFRLKTTYCS